MFGPPRLNKVVASDLKRWPSRNRNRTSGYTGRRISRVVRATKKGLVSEEAAVAGSKDQPNLYAKSADQYSNFGGASTPFPQVRLGFLACPHENGHANRPACKTPVGISSFRWLQIGVDHYESCCAEPSQRMISSIVS